MKLNLNKKGEGYYFIADEKVGKLVYIYPISDNNAYIYYRTDLGTIEREILGEERLFIPPTYIIKFHKDYRYLKN